MPRVIRPFVPEDYVALTGYSTVHESPAFTGVIDGHVVGCAGVAIFPKAPVGMAWAFIGPVAREHGLWVARAVVNGLRRIIDDHRLVRVEADVMTGWPSANRWVEWMGFVKEGEMPKRGPQGETMIRYVLFPRWP